MRAHSAAIGLGVGVAAAAVLVLYRGGRGGGRKKEVLPAAGSSLLPLYALPGLAPLPVAFIKLGFYISLPGIVGMYFAEMALFALDDAIIKRRIRRGADPNAPETYVPSFQTLTKFMYLLHTFGMCVPLVRMGAMDAMRGNIGGLCLWDREFVRSLLGAFAHPVPRRRVLSSRPSPRQASASVGRRLRRRSRHQRHLAHAHAPLGRRLQSVAAPDRGGHQWSRSTLSHLGRGRILTCDQEDKARGRIGLVHPTCARRSLAAWLAEDVRARIGADPLVDTASASDCTQPRYFLHGWHESLNLEDPDLELWTTSPRDTFWASTCSIASRISNGTQYIHLTRSSPDALVDRGAWTDEEDEAGRPVLGVWSPSARSV